MRELIKKTKMAYQILLFSLFAIAFTRAVAYKCYSLQDFCVADLSTSTQVNFDYACIDSKLATADHFFISEFHMASNTSNSIGSGVTLVTATQIPGLNTLGISMARIDYAPHGVVPPHIHPRASEMLTVLEGKIYVGFVIPNLENRLISKILQKGDVFVFPIGLVHFQQNIGHGGAVSISTLSCQNPGWVTTCDAIFGSNPLISSDVLAKAFQFDNNVIDGLEN